MSVQVNNITKQYGNQKAVNNISFTIGEGEIVGFLGPNGAGKTTTMKMLTCFIPQTSGNATVCNFDINENPLEIRKNIGYLPEHNPLYLDMYVKEYLQFVGKVHQVKNGLKNRIADMIETTGLTREQNKKIGQLSKGYRQRVGLASALIHNPKVLILDEPTTGLDPNQLAEIRALIKSLGKEKTLLFSTHIMQEVEAVCDRVIIIDKGEIVADDSISQLQNNAAGNSKFIIEFLPSDKNILSKLNELEFINATNKKSETVFECSSIDGKDIRPNLFRFAVENDLTLIGMSNEENSLEDVFKKLTKQNNV